MNILINVHITPPNIQPFFNQRYYPLIMHIYALEAINIPKMDLLSKTDPYVVFRKKKDIIGARTKYLDDTLTPQWNELVNLIIQKCMISGVFFFKAAYILQLYYICSLNLMNRLFNSSWSFNK